MNPNKMKDFDWGKLFSQFDSYLEQRNQKSTDHHADVSHVTTALSNEYNFVLNEVWKSLSSQSSQSIREDLRNFQLLFLLLWLENSAVDHTRQSNTPSRVDQVMLQFIGIQLPQLFLDGTSSSKKDIFKIFNHADSQRGSLDFVILAEGENETTFMWTQLILQLTNIISSVIQRLFTNSSTEMRSFSTDAPENNLVRYCANRWSSIDKFNTLNSSVILKTRRWIVFLNQLHVQIRETSHNRKASFIMREKHDITCLETSLSEALLMILHTLDDIDIKRVIDFQSQNRKMGKRKDDSTHYSSICLQHSKRRPRDTFIMNSSGMVPELHDASFHEEHYEHDKNDGYGTDCDFPYFYIQNFDHRHRGRRRHFKNQSCSQMNISLKQILNAPIIGANSSGKNQYENNDVQAFLSRSEGGSASSSLKFEASSLRRDLYLYLAEFDTYGIKMLALGFDMKSIDYSVGNKHDSRIQMYISELFSRLIRRLIEYHSAPSIRLHIVVTINYLEEFQIDHNCFLSFTNLLLDTCMKNVSKSSITKRKHMSQENINFDILLKFYAEIVSESDAYSLPTRLIPALSMLMEEILQLNEDKDMENNDFDRLMTLFLESISNIMIRRQNILSVLHRGEHLHPLPFAHELRRYRSLAQQISLKFGTSSLWIHQNMSKDKQMRIIAVLQAEGILSLFCGYHESTRKHNNYVDDCLARSTRAFSYISDHKSKDYPYTYHLSLRCAHDRLGFSHCLSRVLSHPSTYDNHLPLQTHTPSPTNIFSPFSYAHEDVLHEIFSFLSYRSLIRAQCCRTWRQCSTSNNLWSQLYLSKFRDAIFEEEFCTDYSFYVHKQLNDNTRLQCRNHRLVYSQIPAVASLEGYNWMYMFKQRYSANKKLRNPSIGSRNKSNSCKPWKIRLCNVIGCTVVLRNSFSAECHFSKHMKNNRIQKRRREELISMQKEVYNLNQKLCTLEKITKNFNTSSSFVLETIKQAADFDSPQMLLQCLVFPFLDYSDIIKPVCKMWDQIASCNNLWKNLYHQHFGASCMKWLDHSDYPTIIWKEHFCCKFKARLSNNSITNKNGWKVQVCPALKCYSVLRTKLDFDLHIMKHELKLCRNRVKLNSVEKRESAKKDCIIEVDNGLP